MLFCNSKFRSYDTSTIFFMKQPCVCAMMRQGKKGIVRAASARDETDQRCRSSV